MSHLKERREKTCLNCQASPLYGRYCHICGQENLVPKETVWHLIQHFFEDVTHFDGKFFATVKYLLKRPGFLSTEYMNGRRAAYLNPIRMYVFTSAIFFLIFFSLRSSQNFVKFTSVPDKGQKNGLAEINLFGWDEGQYKTVAIYDSIQNGLAAGRRDGWGKRIVIRRVIGADQELQKDSRGYFDHLAEHFLHSFPKILFFSLPFFALILRLLYVRRKQYLYANHGIFTIHFYCAIFIFMLVNMLLGELANRAGSWKWVHTVSNFLIFAIAAYMFIYLYLAMRSFYRQGRWKTFFKYILAGLLGLILNGILFAIFFLISAVEI